MFCIKYLLFPLMVSAGLIVFGSSLTHSSSLISRAILSLFFLAVLVMGLILIYREHKEFIKSGNLYLYRISLGFLVLAIFSVAASISFISNNSTVIGWLVQSGTLFAAFWMLSFAFSKDVLVSEAHRSNAAFAYTVLVIVFSAAISWLIFIFGDFLPLVVDIEKMEWGGWLLVFRVLAASAFLITASAPLFKKNNSLPSEFSGAFLLLAIGSFGVAYLYWFDVLGNHPLIWFNRALTLYAFWAVISRRLA